MYEVDIEGEEGEGPRALTGTFPESALPMPTFLFRTGDFLAAETAK